MKSIRIAFVILACVVLFFGCSAPIDKKKAQSLVESLLMDLKNENYASLNSYYSASFNESETLEQKTEKFKRLKETMGGIRSFELISSKENHDTDKGVNELELKYKVVCERVTVVETYLIISDEGDLKIIFQNIENKK